MSQSLVESSDVAAVGFKVANGDANASVMIERLRDGTWTVIDHWTREGRSARERDRACSLAAAVICGANLVGSFVTDLVIDADVRWVGVYRSERTGRSFRSGRSPQC